MTQGSPYGLALDLIEVGRITAVKSNLPRPRRGEIPVEMRASAVNEMDVQIRSGGWSRAVRRFRRVGSAVTGFEMAGVALADGRHVRKGDRVASYVHPLTGPRTHATVACIPERDLHVIPEALSFDAAAALMSMGLTAIEVVENLAPVNAADRVLVIGAAGGVGSYAVQLAAAKGARVTAICSAKNEDWVKAMGASEVRAYESVDTFQRGDAFNLILDAPGVHSFRRCARYLAGTGAYVSTNPQRDVFGFVWSLFSGRKARWLMMLTTSAKKVERLFALWTQGNLKPAIDSTFPLERADDAFDRFASRGKQGRVLLIGGSRAAVPAEA